jgi:hypothetical protein
MIRQLTVSEINEHIQNDPVRPHITAEFRHTHGRQMWGLFEDQYAVAHTPRETPLAIICVAYTNEAPTCEYELEWYSASSDQDAETINTAVFYTVWSYDRGAGRTIVNTLAKHIKESRSEIKHWVTLSPLTEMATRFHTNNGAVLHSVHDTCQVFEYTHLMSNS